MCYLRVPFHQLASPRGISRRTHPEGEPCITMYKCVFVAFGIFFLFRPSFVVLSAPWPAGSPPEHHGASVGSGRRPWHVLWGFKIASRHSEHVGPCRLLQTHVHVEECPTAHVISGILNVVSVVRHYLLGDGKVFPRDQHARHATTFNTLRQISMTSEYGLFSRI